MATYGMAMIPVFISSWVVNASDRFFVQSMVGLGALGVYALGYKFGALVDQLLVVPFQRAGLQYFFKWPENQMHLITWHASRLTSWGSSVLHPWR